MKNLFSRNYVLLVLTLTILLLAPASQAHQGCCAHNGGVCENSCCDGTPILDDCDSFYSEKSKNNRNEGENSKAVDKASKKHSSGIVFWLEMIIYSALILTFIICVVSSMASRKNDHEEKGEEISKKTDDSF